MFHEEAQGSGDHLSPVYHSRESRSVQIPAESIHHQLLLFIAGSSCNGSRVLLSRIVCIA